MAIQKNSAFDNLFCRQVPKFRFVVLEGSSMNEREASTCTRMNVTCKGYAPYIQDFAIGQVESDLNFETALNYCAQFAHNLPKKSELQAGI